MSDYGPEDILAALRIPRTAYDPDLQAAVRDAFNTLHAPDPPSPEDKEAAIAVIGKALRTEQAILAGVLQRLFQQVVKKEGESRARQFWKTASKRQRGRPRAYNDGDPRLLKSFDDIRATYGLSKAEAAREIGEYLAEKKPGVYGVSAEATAKWVLRQDAKRSRSGT